MPTRPIYNIAYLQEHGPSPENELPTTPRIRHREAGLRFFAVGRGRGGTQAFNGVVTKVAYLEDHDRETVLREFLDENSQLVEAINRRALTQLLGQMGRSWSKLSSDVLDDYYEDVSSRGPTGFGGQTQDCPFCGAEVKKGGLPSHIAGKCEET
ncbi:hypothetical protein [Haloprofundus marisrubri]|uniref:hypothetical protein n=1 Tax=Haloprofundus marisrubri TaxID=1514971 RepID=UPI0012BAC03E|nr:hypothetical protein [Haloprofundus marisrubri]